MKLRLNKDSIRFRFTQSEVEALHGGHALEESVGVGPGPLQRLTYRVTPQDTAGGPAIQAALADNRITVSVSPALLTEWRNGAPLGIGHTQSWPGGEVRILLEKDMQRLNPKPGEEPADVFPNPLFGKARCDHD